MIRVVATVTNDLTYDQRMHRICSTLSEAGYDVTLVGRKRKKSSVLEEQPYQQKRLRCAFNKGPLFYLEFNIRLWLYLHNTRSQIINTVDADTLLAVRVLRSYRKFFWVHDAHELFTEVPELIGRRVIRSIWKDIERISFPHVNKFYTVSYSLAAYYAEICKKNFSVIRNLPYSRFKEVVKPKSDYPEKGFLLYQGALNEGRCIEQYIMAMHHLDGELWLIGEGDLSDKLRGLVHQEKLQDKVKFKGWMKPQDLRQVTLMAEVGLNVLENKGLSYFYSLSNKSLDYIQAGVPSIHSSFPEYLAINDKYDVFQFADPTVDSIVNSIKLLRNDRDLYERLRKNCKLASEDLVWTTEKDKLLAIYDTR